MTHVDLDSLADDQLLLRHRAGESGCFEVLLSRYQTELFRYLVQYVGDVSLAEDAFQQSFLQLHLKSHMYDASRPVRPWLYTIATNQAVDLMRKNARHNLPSLDAPASRRDDMAAIVNLLQCDTPSPLARAEANERAELVRQSVDRLPEYLKGVLIMAYFQGLKYTEIAENLDIPVGTVKSRLHTAVRRLMELWQEIDEDLLARMDASAGEPA